MIAALAIATGCYSTGEGPDPVPHAIYFPVGLAVSPGGGALYVANSDFDLQFNSGTVEAYDLARLRKILEPLWSTGDATVRACAAAGLGVNATPVLQPGVCGPLDLRSPPDAASNPEPIVKASARIGAFATDLLYVCHPSEDPTRRGSCSQSGTADPRGSRLFVPVRGDASLTFFEVDDDRPVTPPEPGVVRPSGAQTFRLDCGQAANNGRCADGHRAGVDAHDNTRGLTLPAEPFAIAVSERTDSILVTHQGSGSVSLFTGLGGASVLDAKPALQYVLGGLPGFTTGVAPLPIPGSVARLGLAATNYQPGFVITYRGIPGIPQVEILRVFDDSFAAPSRPFLSRAAAFPLQSTPSGTDSRGIAIDSQPRAACEADCEGRSDENTCVAACSQVALPAYIANRSPASLLVGEVRSPDPNGASDDITIYETVPLAQGPSRVVVGNIRDRRGVARKRVFVLAFDARIIFVYDPVEHRVDGQIRTGRGPYSLVMDPIEPIAYVGHFTDSYIGLVDLDESHGDTFESLVATIGVPNPPQESK
ncbi:MAG TPA: hypothetical protein VJT73_13690 [Polyangiaceae bacterium]|nr:hypothetical protein [Polyangiaceae bacterium]